MERVVVVMRRHGLPPFFAISRPRLEFRIFQTERERMLSHLFLNQSSISATHSLNSFTQVTIISTRRATVALCLEKLFFCESPFPFNSQGFLERSPAAAESCVFEYGHD